jgi:exonuclease SbcD
MDLMRILFLADTHLGFDFPFRPRVERRRRGPDFFKNYRKALEPAYAGEVDAVIHGGDLFFRSKIPAKLVDMAFEPLKEVADLGVKIYLVPGNHERSGIPFGLLAVHKNIHIFRQPETHLLEKGGLILALSGFPCCKHRVRDRFPDLLEQTGWKQAIRSNHIHLLCTHQAFEGAKVGPVNYTFRHGEDVIRTADIPEKFAAVLAGHIHRYQVLKTGLNGLPLKSPIFIPGSIERTSFAEKDETKGYLILEIDKSLLNGAALSRWNFQKLAARPMKKIEIDVTGLSAQNLRHYLEKALHLLEPDSVVKIVIRGHPVNGSLSILRAAELRRTCPEGMNIELSFPNLF